MDEGTREIKANPATMRRNWKEMRHAISAVGRGNVSEVAHADWTVRAEGDRVEVSLDPRRVEVPWS